MLFTEQFINASITRQNRLKMAETCDNPFALVNEDNISERMAFFNAENTKGQIGYAVSRMYLKNYDISCLNCIYLTSRIGRK